MMNRVMIDHSRCHPISGIWKNIYLVILILIIPLSHNTHLSQSISISAMISIAAMHRLVHEKIGYDLSAMLCHLDSDVKIYKKSKISSIQKYVSVMQISIVIFIHISIIKQYLMINLRVCESMMTQIRM